MLLRSQLQWHFLAMAFISIVIAGCDQNRGPDPDVPLVGHYSLGSYESVNNDGYFVSRGDDVVVSSSVREIGVIDTMVFGRVEDAMVGAMDRVPNGYFILNADTGKLSVGLKKSDLDIALGFGASKSLVPPQHWNN